MNNDERQEEPTRGRAASGREDRIPIPVWCGQSGHGGRSPGHPRPGDRPVVRSWPGSDRRQSRALVGVSNREALGSFVDAWGQAGALADKAFGDLPLPRVGESIAAD